MIYKWRYFTLCQLIRRVLSSPINISFQLFVLSILMSVFFFLIHCANLFVPKCAYIILILTHNCLKHTHFKVASDEMHEVVIVQNSSFSNHLCYRSTRKVDMFRFCIHDQFIVSASCSINDFDLHILVLFVWQKAVRFRIGLTVAC